MRLLTTMFTLALIVVCTCEFANAQRPGALRAWHDNNPGTRFWVDVGGSLFDRPGVDNSAIVALDSVTNETILTVGDISDLQTSFGSTVAFGGTTHTGRIWDAEATLVNWDADTFITGDNLVSPVGGGVAFDSTDIDFDSDLASIEFNLKRPLTQGLTLLAGPRYFRLEETVLTETISGPVTTTNDTRITNSMVGTQIGLELRQQVAQSVFIRTHGKLAGFINRIEFTEDAVDAAGVASLTQSDQTVGAFIGEVGGRVIMDVVPGAFQTFVGYEAVWLGVGSDGDDFDSDFGANNSQTDAIFYHQITFGVTLSR